MQSTRTKILESIAPVVASSKYVQIRPEKVAEVAQALRHEPVPSWDNDLQLFDTPEKTAQYYFFIDSCQGCFWAPKGQQRWEYKIGDEWRGGYYGFSRAVKDAFLRDVRLSDAAYLADISEADFAAIFPGRNSLLLLEERRKYVRQNFSTLRDRYAGSAITLLAHAEGDVDRLIGTLLEEFQTFRDQAEWQGQTVYFLKRAQIFPSDMHFSGITHPAVTFSNLDHLTIFADYKLPQLLEALGVLVYGEELDADIVNEVLIPAGSEKEIELRACTISAGEQISTELHKLGRSITMHELDWLLWVKSQRMKFQKPHHKTVTLFY